MPGSSGSLLAGEPAVGRLSTYVALGAATIAAVALAACGQRDTVSAAAESSPPPAAAESSPPSAAAERREDALKRARVWSRPAVTPAKADLGVNTPAPDAFDASEDVDCSFV